MATTTRLPHTSDTPYPPGYGTLRRDETPADGWDDPSADMMNAEADAKVADALDRTRQP